MNTFLHEMTVDEFVKKERKHHTHVRWRKVISNNIDGEKRREEKRRSYQTILMDRDYI